MLQIHNGLNYPNKTMKYLDQYDKTNKLWGQFETFAQSLAHTLKKVFFEGIEMVLQKSFYKFRIKIINTLILYNHTYTMQSGHITFLLQ